MADLTTEAIEARYEAKRLIRDLVARQGMALPLPFVARLEAAVEWLDDHEAEDIIPEGEGGGEPFIICDTCGSLEHEADACTSGLAPGFAYRAYQWHTDHLPNNPRDCEAAGHCGHAPCCNCSGEDPDPAVIEATREAYKASGKDVRCEADGCTRLPFQGGPLCDLHTEFPDLNQEDYA